VDFNLLQSIVNKIGLGVAIINDSNQIIWYNDKFANYFSINTTNSENLGLTTLHTFFNDESFSTLKNKIKFSYSSNKVYEIQSKQLNANFWFLEVSDISIQTYEDKDVYFRANYDLRR